MTKNSGCVSTLTSIPYSTKMMEALLARVHQTSQADRNIQKVSLFKSCKAVLASEKSARMPMTLCRIPASSKR